MERGIEPAAQMAVAVELQLGEAFVAPGLPRAPEQVTDRVSPSDAAFLQDVDLAPTHATVVPAEQAADHPADRRVASPQVDDVLLRLEGRLQDGALVRRRAIAPRGETVHSLDHRNPLPRTVTLLLAVPPSLALNRLGQSPAMCEPKSSQDGPGRRGSELLHQFLAQEPDGGSVDDQHPMVAKAYNAIVSGEIQQLSDVHLVRLHRLLRVSD